MLPPNIVEATVLVKVELLVEVAPKIAPPVEAVVDPNIVEFVNTVGLADTLEEEPVVTLNIVEVVEATVVVEFEVDSVVKVDGTDLADEGSVNELAEVSKAVCPEVELTVKAFESVVAVPGVAKLNKGDLGTACDVNEEILVTGVGILPTVDGVLVVVGFEKKSNVLEGRLLTELLITGAIVFG